MHLTSSPHPKLVLLHGMGGTGKLWRPLSAALEDTVTLLAPDQLGHGSRRLGPEASARVSYTPMDYARDLVHTLEEQSFFPCWLLGHSMGVRTACATAAFRPEAIQGLFLIDLGLSGAAGGGLGKPLAEFVRVLPRSFPSRTEARTWMLEHCPDPSIVQYLLAVSQVDPVTQALFFPFDHEALVQTVEATQHFSVRQSLLDYAQLGKPVFLLRGAQSLVWSAEEYETEQEYFKNYPNVHFETWDGAGHGLPFELRQKLAEFIRHQLHR